MADNVQFDHFPFENGRAITNELAMEIVNYIQRKSYPESGVSSNWKKWKLNA